MKYAFLNVSARILAAHVVALVFLLTFFAPAITLAASAGDVPYIPLAPIPGTVQDGCDFTSTSAECKTTFMTYLNGAYKTAIGVAGMLAVVMIIWWGFQYVLTASEGGKTDSREGITNAIVGLLLTLGSWLIVYTINPKLVQLDFKTEKATDYEPVDLQKAFENQIAEYQQNNTENAKQRSAVKAEIKAKEEAIQNAINNQDAYSAEVMRDELKEIKVKESKLIVSDALNTAAENVTQQTAPTEIDPGNSISTVDERLQRARNALVGMEKTFNTQAKLLEANGAADQIPELKAAFEQKKKELTELIDHRQRCPGGDTKYINTGTSGSVSVPCK